MKNNNFFQRSPLQNSFHMKHSHQPLRYSQRDYSLDRNITRISPAPQDRLSHAPGPAVYPLAKYPSNDYQLAPRVSEFHLSTSDSSKLVMELLQRVQKLEAKNDRWERLEIRADRIEASSMKVESKVQKLLSSSRQRTSNNKENMFNMENKLKEETSKSKLKNDFVTKEELQKQLSGLDGAFKNLFSTFRTTINAEVGEYNTKSKKKFIEITATQLSQKLQQFKSNFLKQWNTQIQSVVKDTWNQQTEGKSVLGLSKEKFLGTVTPIKVKEELSTSVDSKDKELMAVQTLYYVDEQGYLLDQNRHYLLNVSGDQIRLDEERLSMLRKQGLLSAELQEQKLTKSHSAS